MPRFVAHERDRTDHDDGEQRDGRGRGRRAGFGEGPCRERQQDAERDGARDVGMRGAPRRLTRGERTPGDREGEARQREVHEEDEPPVDRGQEPAEERTDCRADARRRARDAEVRTRPSIDGAPAEKSEAVRDDGRRGDRLLEPERDQHDQVRRERCADRRDDEVDERAEHEAPPPEAITEAAGDRLQRGHRDEVRGHEPREGHAIGAEVATDQRERDDDHRRVEGHEEVAERDREDERRDAGDGPHARRTARRALPPVACRSGVMRAAA